MQSIVAQLDVARNAYNDAPYFLADAKVKKRYNKQCRDLLQAGLCELVGEFGVKLQESPPGLSDRQRLIVTRGMPGGGSSSLQLGPALAAVLNDSRRWESPTANSDCFEEAKPSDIQCVRSEHMLRMMISHVALDQTNLSLNEVLDPITPEDMKAFGGPGGLLSRPPQAAIE